MPAAWHVVFTRPGRERRVASDLCCLDDVAGFCPSQRARWFQRGRIVERPLPLLSRVAFALWDGDDAGLWHKVKNTKHAAGILGGEFPAAVRRDEAFDLWLKSADDEWCVPGIALKLAQLKRGYWEGSEVVVNYRGLRGARGVVESIEEVTLCAWVRYNMLGRPQRRRFPLLAISAVGVDVGALG